MCKGRQQVFKNVAKIVLAIMGGAFVCKGVCAEPEREVAVPIKDSSVEAIPYDNTETLPAREVSGSSQGARAFEVNEPSAAPGAKEEPYRNENVSVGSGSTDMIAPEVSALEKGKVQADSALVPSAPVSHIPVWTEPKYIAANKKLMDELYVGISGFVRRISPEEQAFIKGEYTKKTYVYGEILYDSLQTILDNEHFGPNDVVYDLGSGMGKMVTQVYLNTPVKKVVGVELSHTRYVGAMEMFTKFKQTDAYNERKRNGKTRRVMAFQEKDFLKANLDDATIIYMCSTCFPPELLEKLLTKFEKINRLGLRIITLKELPDYQKYGFRFERRYDLPMSWSKPGNTSKVFVYAYAGNIFV